MKTLRIAALNLFFVLSIFVVPDYAQTDSELVKLSDYFGKYYQYADEKRMIEALAEDFRYFTNVECPYKNCENGAGKADYIAGVISERKENGFRVESLFMKYIVPIKQAPESASERKLTFYAKLTTKAFGKTYEYFSVIDYYFRKELDTWKISKIENRIIDR